MYTQTQEWSQQSPVPRGLSGGTLGGPAFSPEIAEFFNQVRRKPDTYRKLLLTITFHPTPSFNPVYGKLSFVYKGKPRFLVDEVLMSNAQLVDILDELRRIRDARRKADSGFRQRVEAELRLRKALFKTVGRLVRDALLRTQGNKVPPELEPALLDALLTGYTYDSWRQVLSFAKKFLPSTLVERIMKSEISEAHLTQLGSMLRRYGEMMQTKDPAFKQRVEQERTKRAAPKRTK